MSKRRGFRFLAVALLAVACVVATPPVALAGPVSYLVVYGDSLSDNGNFRAATGEPPSPYWNGRWSNGPVAVERLASNLGVPLVDFAWSGATTGVGNIGDGGTPTSFGALALPGMLTMFDATKGTLGPLTGGLFVVWGGLSDSSSPSPLDTTPEQMIARSVNDLLTIVYGLQDLGVANILVPGLPDLGLTPHWVSQGPSAAAQASAYTDAFNTALLGSLPAGVMYLDSAALLRAAVANPAAYGFTSVNEPCFDGGTVCANPGEYLFWDDIHPTTAGHEMLAQGFASTVTPVPEPTSLLLLGTGLVGVVRAVRKRRS